MIISFFGAMQSGKSTATKYIAGLSMKKYGIIQDFSIQEDKLVITTDVDQCGVVTTETFPFDLKNKDYEFIRYAERKIFPFVKIYSYADPMKEFIHKMFGVPWENLYGTSDQKNQPTQVMWDNILKLLPSSLKKEYSKNKGRPATVRELLQIFGTEICRTLYTNCHVEACFTDILTDNPEVGLIDDGRFINEFKYAKEHGKVVKLERQLEEFKSVHPSEAELLSISNDEFDYVIPDCSIEEKHQHINKMLVQFGLNL